MRSRLVLALSVALVAVVLPVPLKAVPTLIPLTETSVILGRNDPEPALMAVGAMDGDTPIPNPSVTWEAPTTGPTADIEVQVDEDLALEGISFVLLRPRGGNGTYQITARLGGLSLSFLVENRGFGVTHLTVVGGAEQSALINATFADALAVRATDRGDPVAGQVITFQPAAGASATLSSITAVTDADGVAFVTATANALAGLHTVAITTPGATGSPVSTSLRLSNLAIRPSTLVAAGPVSMSTPANTEFTDELRVIPQTASGAPVANAAVTWATPLIGPGIAALNYVDDSGFIREAFQAGPGVWRFIVPSTIARALVRANSAVGPHALAVVSESTPAFTFSLTNTPALPARILPNGTNAVIGESTRPGGRFDEIAFRVVDEFLLPATGLRVVLEPPATGPTVTLDATELFTDFDGWVRTGGTANATPGVYHVRATVDGLATPAFMLMHNRPTGYSVGEQLANPTGSDHTGATRTLRSLLTGGFLLLDTCAEWCGPCHAAQGEAVAAKNELTSQGIALTFVPLLIEGEPGVPSNAENASEWRNEFSIPDPVLHVSGQRSAFWEAGQFILGTDIPSLPTYLLVSPDGTILERFTEIRTANQLVDLVTAHLPAFTVADVTVNEGVGTSTVTVSRSATGFASSVQYHTTAGTAGSGDFSSAAGTLSFGPTQSTATITVSIADDPTDEPGETFSVHLSAPAGGVIGDNVAVVTIVDNDSPAALSIDDLQRAEGTGGPSTFAVPVRLDRVSGFAITVPFSVAFGTARSADLTAANGSMTIPAGQTTANINVLVTADTLAESKETFTVTLGQPSNASIADGQAVVSIVDDDFDTLAPQVSAKADVVVEVRMAANGAVVVPFTNPSAVDNIDRALPTTCVQPSGSKFSYGRTVVRCTAEDRAGNVGLNSFGVVVQIPTVPGAVFSADNPGGPALTEIRGGQPIEVRVNAGAFESKAKVTVSLIDANGRSFDLGTEKARADGSFEFGAQIPAKAALGFAQVFAQSTPSTGSDYDRAWLLTVLPR